MNSAVRTVALESLGPARNSLMGLAEGAGFEPAELSLSGFQDHRLKPLGHPSALGHLSGFQSFDGAAAQSNPTESRAPVSTVRLAFLAGRGAPVHAFCARSHFLPSLLHFSARISLTWQATLSFPSVIQLTAERPS